MTRRPRRKRPRIPNELMTALVLAAALLIAPVEPVLAQNAEMRARICENLSRKAEEESWPDRSAEYDRIVGVYDDRERERSTQDWRLERICDGRFVWAIALFGDVAPFPLMPTEQPTRYIDFRENQWVFTEDEDGNIRHLDWIWKTGESFRLVPVD